MRSIRLAAALGLIAAVSGFPGLAADQSVTFDKTFLTDYSRLVPRQSANGMDFAYIPPQAIESLAQYNAIMVDQPEILISPNSDYRGAKPENLATIADSMREALDARLKGGGYNVVDKPGPGVLYVRVALTDLELTKKKRGLLSYTPVGAVVKFGSDNRLILTPVLDQVMDPGILRDLKIPLQACDLILIKSRVHFWRGFVEDGLAKAVVVIDAPGLGPADVSTIPYTHASRDIYPIVRK